MEYIIVSCNLADLLLKTSISSHKQLSKPAQNAHSNNRAHLIQGQFCQMTEISTFYQIKAVVISILFTDDVFHFVIVRSKVIKLSYTHIWKIIT